MVDTDPSAISAGGALEDTSAVKKFELSKDEYDSQGGAKFRAFRAARLKKKEGATKIDDSFQKDEAAALTVGRYGAVRRASPWAHVHLCAATTAAVSW